MALIYTGQVCFIEDDRNVRTRRGNASIRTIRLIDNERPIQVYRYVCWLPHGENLKIGDSVVIDVTGLSLFNGNPELKGTLKLAPVGQPAAVHRESAPVAKRVG